MLALVSLIVLIVLFGFFTFINNFRQRDFFSVIGSSILVGVLFFIFSINLLSYIFGVKNALITTVIIMFCFTFFYISKFKNESLSLFLEKRSWKIFLIGCTVSFMAFITSLKAIDPDDYGHYIFAKTMLEGNFPMNNPFYSSVPLSYHYGPDLLAGSIHYLTKISLEVCFDIQIGLFVFSTFFILISLLNSIFNSSKIATFGTIAFMYGGGLQILNFFEAIPMLYQRFILKSTTGFSWSFLAKMIWPEINHFYFFGIRNYTAAMGISISVFSFWFLFNFIRTSRTSIKEVVIIGIFFSLLGLSQETNFVIISFILLTFCIPLRLFSTKIDFFCKQNIKYFITFFLTSSFLLATQGGIVSSAIKTKLTDYYSNTKEISNFGSDGKVSFSLNSNPLRYFRSYDTPENNIDFFSYFNFKEFGIVGIVFPLAIFYFRKNVYVTILSYFGIVSFFIPLLIVFEQRPWELVRIYSISFPMLSMITTLFLYKKILSIQDGKYFKIFYMFFAFIIIGGFNFQISSVITSYTNFGKMNSPLVAKLPAYDDSYSKVINWVENNTQSNSNFFLYDPLFIIRTGRFTPGDYYTLFPQNLISVYNEIETTCNFNSFIKLNINYLLISNNSKFDKLFFEKCNKFLFEIKFSIQDKEQYIEIYKVKNEVKAI